MVALLSWMDNKGFYLYDSIKWGAHDKKQWNHVLKAFKEHFKPCQTVMQSWYQLGSLYSSNCKDQTEFVTRIKLLVGEGGFKEKEKVIKFLFVIYNTVPKVNAYLIDKRNLTKTCSDFLNLVRSVESMVQTETMSKQMLQNMGKLSINAVQDHTQASGQQWQRSSSKQSNKSGGSQHGSLSGHHLCKNCGRCGRKHALRNCSTYGQNCKCCGAKGHYAKYCRSRNPRNPKECYSHWDTYEVFPETGREL